MSETIRFHLDENVSNAIAESLRRRGIDVTTTPSAGLMGFSDEEQIAFALEQNRVIFTQDTDFLRLNQISRLLWFTDGIQSFDETQAS
jgi:predicted nuclease of predicted toxin-antitoxin system